MVYVVITEVSNIFKKKKNQKSQINGTILIKKKIQLKTPKKYE